MLRIASVFVAAMVYSIVRYIVFAPQNLQHLPVFVLNKGISTAAALCFVLAFWQQWRRQRGKVTGNEPASWFRAGMFGVVTHIPLALTIIRPEYFQEFFSGSRLSMTGEAIFLFGALTAGGVYLLTRANWSAVHRWWLSLGVMCSLLGHTLFMGIARGINLSRTHAYLPPMWMLSMIAVALGIAYLLMSKPDASIAGATSGKPTS